MLIDVREIQINKEIFFEWKDALRLPIPRVTHAFAQTLVMH